MAALAYKTIEWYNFYIFGSLASIIAPKLFPGLDPASALLCTLAIFAAGFAVRPFGALVFRRPDRKFNPSLTPILMGASTFAIGLIPDFERIGLSAPLIVLLLRLLQGLASGADQDSSGSNHLAAHTRPAAALGLLINLGVILLVRYGLDTDHETSIVKFNAWGWRIPFLLSVLLMPVAVYLARHHLPVNRPAFGRGVVFYTGLFYAPLFLEKTAGLDFGQVTSTLLIAVTLAIPFFLVFGSGIRGTRDRIGRKWVTGSGTLLAALTWFFLFQKLLTIPGIEGRKELTEQKEIRSTVAFIGKSHNLIRTSATYLHYKDGTQIIETRKDTVFADRRTESRPLVTVAKTLDTGDYWKIIGVLLVMALYAAMVGAADFPGFSYPATVANEILGGLTPFIAVLLTIVYPDNKLAGLWYAVITTAGCFVTGVIYSISHRKFAHVN